MLAHGAVCFDADRATSRYARVGMEKKLGLLTKVPRYNMVNGLQLIVHFL